MENNEKVLAMYRAVWELLDEGQDMAKMKVADITARAGIGKGTAYEYFRSKEEIVCRALEYDFFMQYQKLKSEVHEKRNFRDALESCFDWLKQNEDRRRLVVQFLRGGGCAAQREEQEKKLDALQEKAADAVKQILGYVVSLGKAENFIDRMIPDRMAILQILSQLLGFFLYTEMGRPAGDEETEAVKAFLCGNIEKSLR